METKWSDFGFMGSLLLVLYGLFSLLIFFTPPSFYGPIAPFISGAMAVFGMVTGICFSLGFYGLRIELDAPGSWSTFFTIIWTMGAWFFTGVSQIVMALGYVIGLVYWFFSIYGIMLMFLIWGMFYFSLRKQLGGRGRFAFGASVLFLINGLAWMSFMGFGILALAAFLCLFIFTPATKFSIFSPIVRFFSPKRTATFRNWGSFFLIIYSFLGIKWLINGFYPIPVVAVAVVNIFSLVFGCLAAIGIVLVLRTFEKKYENNYIWYAQLVWLPGFLLLILADLQWLMSNFSVFIDLSWGFILYETLIFYLWWSSIPLTIFSFLAALGFIQIYRLPEHRGEILLLFVHLAILFTGILWLTIAISISGLLPIALWLLYFLGLDLLDLFSLGYIGFIFTGFFLWRHWVRESKKE